MYRKKSLKQKKKQKILYFSTLYVTFVGLWHVDSNLLCTLYDTNTVPLKTSCCKSLLTSGVLG